MFKTYEMSKHKYDLVKIISDIYDVKADRLSKNSSG